MIRGKENAGLCLLLTQQYMHKQAKNQLDGGHALCEVLLKLAGVLLVGDA